jgi:hypothetical protein
MNLIQTTDRDRRQAPLDRWPSELERRSGAPGRRAFDLAAFHDVSCNAPECVAHREALAEVENRKGAL